MRGKCQFWTSATSFLGKEHGGGVKRWRGKMEVADQTYHHPPHTHIHTNTVFSNYMK